MPIKLLPKSEVAKAQAAEQKRHIDEGVKLARRVDNLREVAAQEEASLERFRRETLAKIHVETAQAKEERDTVRKEVAELKEERKKLMRPLDKEWQEVERAKEEALKAKEAAREHEKAAKEDRDAARADVKRAQDLVARAETKDGVSRTRLQRAVKDGKEAERRLRNATTVESRALRLKEAVEKDLAHRDMECAARERGITMKEALLQEREAELEKGWRLLKDREDKFARTITRNNKKSHGT